ncbi:MAG: hypothetical protein SFW35_10680 [Chitinophagales bacterium]|nr:hypothetical protein [Chitinophagales bacterium]
MVTEVSDSVLLEQFLQQTLPAAEWTHRAHLRVAFQLSKSHSLEAAFQQMKHGILALNKVHGVIETPERGYHETITYAWVQLIHPFAQQLNSSEALFTQYPQLLQPTFLLQYYDREVLHSLEARKTYIPSQRELML